ncbi:MAG: tripartite tricarboxylate transporter substrate binding protein [Betaproteobacteria bacterium]
MRYVMCALLGLFALVHEASAQAYPSRTVRLVVPFPPGGSADALARPLAERLSADLGQPVIVDNRGGGNTVIGADIVAKSAPDGYTLYLMPGAHVLSTRLMKNVPYHPIRDFTPVSMIVTTPYVIFSGANYPFKSLAELLAYAAANPDKISIGTTDALGKVVVATLNKYGKIQITEVSYKGAGPLASDVVGGHLSLGVNTPAVVNGLQKAGSVRALALTGVRRLPLMKEIPTVAESIGAADFDVHTWFVLAGPANLPAAVADRLQVAMAKILADQGLRERLINLGMAPVDNTSAAAAAAMMQAYMDRMGALLESSGIRPE